MKRIDPRDYYRSQPGCGKAVIQVVGTNALLHAPSKEHGDMFLLLKRDDMTYSAIGGASDLFVDDSGNVVRFESEPETLRREFNEETGQVLLEKTSSWYYLGCYITINHYNHYPDVHGVGTYFSILTSLDRIHQYASGESSEGKIVILTTNEVLQALKDGKVFSNTAPALTRLLQYRGLMPENQ